MKNLSAIIKPGDEIHTLDKGVFFACTPEEINNKFTKFASMEEFFAAMGKFKVFGYQEKTWMGWDATGICVSSPQLSIAKVVQQKPESFVDWINVKDCLPEINEQVLVAYGFIDSWARDQTKVHWTYGCGFIYDYPDDHVSFPGGYRWQSNLGCSHNDHHWWARINKPKEI